MTTKTTTTTDFTAMSGLELVRAHNEMATEAAALGSTSYRPTQRFMNRSAGVRRCEALASSVRALRASAAAVAAEYRPEPDDERVMPVGTTAGAPAGGSDPAAEAMYGPGFEEKLAEDEKDLRPPFLREEVPAYDPKPAAEPAGRARAPRARKAAPEARERAGRAAGKPAGAPKDFRPVRAGTARARVVQALVDGLTIEAATKAAGVDRKTLMVHLACLSRDCAIGHAVEGEKLRVLVPLGKTADDLIKKAE